MATIANKYARVTPLHLAAYNGHLDVVKELAERGANLSATDSDAKVDLCVMLLVLTDYRLRQKEKRSLINKQLT